MMRVLYTHTYFHMHDVCVYIPLYIIHTYIMRLHDACVIQMMMRVLYR